MPNTTLALPDWAADTSFPSTPRRPVPTGNVRGSLRETRPMNTNVPVRGSTGQAIIELANRSFHVAYSSGDFQTLCNLYATRGYSGGDNPVQFSPGWVLNRIRFTGSAFNNLCLDVAGLTPTNTLEHLLATNVQLVNSLGRIAVHMPLFGALRMLRMGNMEPEMYAEQHMSHLYGPEALHRYFRSVVGEERPVDDLISLDELYTLASILPQASAPVSECTLHSDLTGFNTHALLLAREPLPQWAVVDDFIEDAVVDDIDEEPESEDNF